MFFLFIIMIKKKLYLYNDMAFDSMVYLMKSFFFYFFKFIAINGNPKGGHFDSMKCHGIFLFFNSIAINGRGRPL